MHLLETVFYIFFYNAKSIFNVFGDFKMSVLSSVPPLTPPPVPPRRSTPKQTRPVSMPPPVPPRGEETNTHAFHRFDACKIYLVII